MKSRYLFFLLLSFLFSPSLIHGAVLRVPAGHVTIAQALKAAVSGDTVRVAGGTYFEHITLKRGVKLEGGWSSDYSKRDIVAFETVIDGIKKKGPVVIGADKAVIEGFTIVHGTLLKKDGVDLGSGIYCLKTSPVISRNIIRDNEPAGVYCNASAATISENRIEKNQQAGIYLLDGSRVKISFNEIRNNGYSGIGSAEEQSDTSAKNNLKNSEFEIVNNRIHGNKRSGINAEKATGLIRNNLIYNNTWSGIRCIPMPVSVINNTVTGNGRSGILVEDPQAVATIRNNIFVHNGFAGIQGGAKGYDHNLLFANSDTGDCNPGYLWCVKAQFGGYGDEKSYKKQRNIIADPLFVDAENGDFHLRGSSPAIDGGVKKTEFDDVSFPPSLGTRINDIGAYGGPHTRPEKRKGNRAPRAMPGTDRKVFVGKRLILDGSASSDPDGDALSYRWRLSRKPKGSRATLKRAERVKTGFTPDKPGTYKVELIVTDSLGKAGKAGQVTITALDNRPPRAVIGEVLSQVSVGDTITLFGSGSKDPEGAALTYSWSLDRKPRGSRAELSSADKEKTVLAVDREGSYVVRLVVGDGTNQSDPAELIISTKTTKATGKRLVPDDYPTIQSAIDAAAPGDDIIVRKGRYTELLVIDKSVNLIGEDWPIIDGGSRKGDKSTIAVYYLGDRAGKIEGFVITGGGVGDLGHGINIWDSAPDIFNNRITGNNHGMGIHGSPALTGKARIHGNLVYDNLVGIGNGKDSSARIYNNRVYNNKVVGIGCRGKATPRIEFNEVYGNRLGIGARETASPTIRGNIVHDNVDGIVISPLSTIKMFAFKRILIDNNLIVRNRHLGIAVSSFNLSPVTVSNNTIDHNNGAGRKIRAGGLVFGYPQPAVYEALVEKNIVSNNGFAGILNYTGHKNFQSSGARLRLAANTLWNNQQDHVGCRPGADTLNRDPGFAGKTGPRLKEYLAAATGDAGRGYTHQPEAFAELPPALDQGDAAPRQSPRPADGKEKADE